MSRAAARRTAAALRIAAAPAVFIALIAFAAFHGGASRAAQPLVFEYLGQQTIPAGTPALGTRFGGISGIDYDAAADRYWAISDDRSRYAPARVYRMAIDLSRFVRFAEAGSDGIAFEAVVPLRRADGSTYPRYSIDPEAIRIAPDGRLLWATEGARGPFGGVAPIVSEALRDGRFSRELPVPAYYRPGPGVGVRGNLGFEALSLTPSGTTLWVATENALVQDGPRASPQRGSPSRWLSFDLASGRPGRELIYQTEPVTHLPIVPGLPAVNGLVEILAIDDHRFLALERSFSAGSLPVIRLFLAQIGHATDVAGIASIASLPALVPMRKTLLLDSRTLRNDNGSHVMLDNIEAMSFGPAIDGVPTLLLVSDDNFSSSQLTQLLAFRIHGLPPTSRPGPPRTATAPP